MKSPTYKQLAWYPILAVGLSMMSFILIKTARDTVFFQNDGLRQLPLAYIWIAFASIPAGVLHLNMIERFGARRTRIGVFFIAALTFLIFFPFVDINQRALMTMMFIWVPTIFAALFAGAWLLAGDLLEGADETIIRWAYSRIGAGSMIGGVLGGLIGKGLSSFAGPKYLILGGALVLILVGALLSKAHQRRAFSETKNEKSPTKKDSVFKLVAEQKNLIKQPYILILLGVSVSATMAALFIDFQFYATAMITGNNNAQFFANFYIVLNTASLLLQIFMAPRLQRKFGVAGALLLLPTVLFGMAGTFTVWTFVQARSVLKVTEGGLKASIHRSFWEQAFLLVDREKRPIVKMIVDGMFARMGEGLASIVLLIWLLNSSGSLQDLNLRWISWVIVGVIGLWIGLTRRLRTAGCSRVSYSESAIRLHDGCPIVSTLGGEKRR